MNSSRFTITREVVQTTSTTVDLTKEGRWAVPVAPSSQYHSLFLVIPCNERGRWEGPPVLRSALDEADAIESAIRNDDGWGFEYIPSKVYVVSTHGFLRNEFTGRYYGVTVVRQEGNR